MTTNNENYDIPILSSLYYDVSAKFKDRMPAENNIGITRTAVPAAKLEKNFGIFGNTICNILNKIEGEIKDYQLDSVSVNVAITNEGELAFIGIVDADTKIGTTLTLTFKKK